MRSLGMAALGGPVWGEDYTNSNIREPDFKLLSIIFRFLLWLEPFPFKSWQFYTTESQMVHIAIEGTLGSPAWFGGMWG